MKNVKRNVLVKLATENGIAKASSTKSVVLIELLNEMNVDTTVKKKGRKIDPTSKRQIRLAELAEKRANGELKKGRPINSESKRQQRLAELELKRSNGTLKKGRPVSKDSKRQIRLAELAAKKANGTLSKGRPVNPNSKRQIALAAKLAKKNEAVEVENMINEAIEEVIVKEEK